MIKTHHILKIYPLKRSVHFTYLEDVLVRRIHMKQWNYSNARAQLTMIMDQTVAGHPVEITRRGPA